MAGSVMAVVVFAVPGITPVADAVGPGREDLARIGRWVCRRAGRVAEGDHQIVALPAQPAEGRSDRGDLGQIISGLKPPDIAVGKIVTSWLTSALTHGLTHGFTHG